MRAMNGHAEELVLGCLEEMGCGAAAVAPAHRFEEDLGLDSIEVVELVAMVLKKAGLPAGAVMPAVTRTVGELVTEVSRASMPQTAEAS